jgi:threonine/homoserine/homoserine lactone efflux protein
MMPVDPGKYSAFLIAMFLMAITPGPANLFFVRTGLAGSKRRVLLGVLGVNLATLVWFCAAALGLQIILIALPLLFPLIAIAGGLYLGWISLSSLRRALDIRNEKPGVTLSQAVNPDTPFVQTFRQGFMVQLLNPKITLFFSAVLPPFLDIHRPMPQQMTIFAATTIGMDVIAMTSYGFGAVTLTRLLSHPRNKQVFDITVSLILLAIAAAIVWHAVSALLPG